MMPSGRHHILQMSDFCRGAYDAGDATLLPVAFAVSSGGPALTRLASLDACLERVGLAQRKTLVVPAQSFRGRGLRREDPAGGAGYRRGAKETSSFSRDASVIRCGKQ